MKEIILENSINLYKTYKDTRRNSTIIGNYLIEDSPKVKNSKIEIFDEDKNSVGWVNQKDVPVEEKVEEPKADDIIIEAKEEPSTTIKVGSKVKFKKKITLDIYKHTIPEWFSKQIVTITNIDNNYATVKSSNGVSVKVRLNILELI